MSPTTREQSERSFCQRELAGSNLARRSATARLFRYDVSAPAKSCCANCTSPMRRSPTEMSCCQIMLAGSVLARCFVMAKPARWDFSAPSRFPSLTLMFADLFMRHRQVPLPPRIARLRLSEPLIDPQTCLIRRECARQIALGALHVSYQFVKHGQIPLPQRITRVVSCQAVDDDEAVAIERQ